MIPLHCMVCCKLMSERHKRAKYCPKCERLVDNEKRAEQAKKKCRTCGRRFRKQKAILEPVRSPHTDPQEMNG